MIKISELCNFKFPVTGHDAEFSFNITTCEHCAESRRKMREKILAGIHKYAALTGNTRRIAAASQRQ